jgi:hypothetical protein
MKSPFQRSCCQQGIGEFSFQHRHDKKYRENKQSPLGLCLIGNLGRAVQKQNRLLT